METAAAEEGSEEEEEAIEALCIGCMFAASADTDGRGEWIRAACCLQKKRVFFRGGEEPEAESVRARMQERANNVGNESVVSKTPAGIWDSLTLSLSLFVNSIIHADDVLVATCSTLHFHLNSGILSARFLL